MVVALQNRDAPNGTTVSVPMPLLSERNAFFSFAMLAPAAARAMGYAKSVSLNPPAQALPSAPKSYAVHDVLEGKDMGTVDATGTLSAPVDTGDTRLFILMPTA